LKKAHSASSCLRRGVEDCGRPYHSSKIYGQPVSTRSRVVDM
jgi:hypothetical protein